MKKLILSVVMIFAMALVSGTAMAATEQTKQNTPATKSPAQTSSKPQSSESKTQGQKNNTTPKKIPSIHKTGDVTLK